MRPPACCTGGAAEEEKFGAAYSAPNLQGQAFEVGQMLGDWFISGSSRVCLCHSTTDVALVIDHLWQHGELTDR